jgi:hypothetical protein
LFFPAAAQVKEKTSRNRQKGKNMKLEEVNNTNQRGRGPSRAALESGQSEVLTQYLGAMAKFHNYSFGNIMLIADRSQTLPTLPDFAHGTRLAAS